MKIDLTLPRRTLFQTMAAATVVSLLDGKHAAAAAPAAALKIGLASYSLRKLPFDKMLEACKEMGVQYISVKDVHLPMTDAPEKLKDACAKIRAAGVTVMGGGVIGMKNNEADVRKSFEYARICGFPLMVIAPDHDAIDVIETLVKEFDIKVAIHNHGTNDKYPTSREALEQLKGRDKRMGVCLDIGHATEAGGDAVKLVRQAGARLFDLHVKDQKVKTDMSTRCEVGKGAVDVPGVFKALRKLRFAGHIGLEYELNPDSPIAGIKESLAYMRGVSAGLNAA